MISLRHVKLKSFETVLLISRSITGIRVADVWRKACKINCWRSCLPKNNKSKSDRKLHGVGVFYFVFVLVFFFFFTFSSNRRTCPIHAVTLVHWINHYPLDDAITSDRAVFKWLSKLITSLRLLRLVIGLKDSRQFFNQWDAKSKPIAPCTRDFSALRASYR